MKIIKYEKKKNGKYKILLEDNNTIDTYEDVILNNNLLLKKDITINLRHIMDFGDGEFEIRILNNNVVVHSMKELVLYAGEYI